MKALQAAMTAVALLFTTIASAGQFGTPRIYPVKSRPVYLAVGDFNDDGKLDLAVAAGPEVEATINILFGNGDGTFRKGFWMPIGEFASGMAAGDVNKDGELDLVVQHFIQGSQHLSVFLGKGDGTFQPPISNNVITTGLLLQDLNNDGNLDIVGFNNSASILIVLLGKGDGTFGNPVEVAAGSYPNSIVAADFNLDGKVDVLVTNSTGDSMSVLLGNGDGSFQPFISYPAGHQFPHLVQVGDFNGDGIPDAIAANSAPSRLSVMLGNGDGSFQSPISSTITSCCGVWGLAPADYDRDGKLDVVSSNVKGQIDLLVGSGDGRLNDISHINIRNREALGPALAADFNGDNFADLVLANGRSQQVIVLINTGSGN